MTRDEKLTVAGEFVLGLLEGRELAAFEAARGEDPELASMVAALSARLAVLDDTVVPSEVSPDLWHRIEGALVTAEPAKRESPTLLLQKAPARPRPHPGWQNQAPWTAIAASVLLAAAAGYWAGTTTSRRPEPLVIAVLLNPADASPGAIIEAFGDDTVTVRSLDAFEVPAGRVLQVWTLPDPATGPVSLGTIAAPASLDLIGPDLPLPQAGQLYEITLEPAPGSPTGRPTGPILAKGFAKPPVS